jgi:hypothetical protein
MELLNILPGVAEWRKRLVPALAAFVLAPGAVGAAEGEALEYAVKAAYLSKFGHYVEWPNAAFPPAGNTATLCIAGEDPFGTVLDKAVADQSIAGKSIVVRRLKTVGRDSGCHVLYIGRSDKPSARQLVDAVRGSSVLTVSDTRSADAGAVINFVVKDNRVRFDIDEEAAVQNELTLSSKLLSLALNVKRRQKETR